MLAYRVRYTVLLMCSVLVWGKVHTVHVSGQQDLIFQVGLEKSLGQQNIMLAMKE